MKNFFKQMNLARGIILFSLVGVLVLGVIGWQRQQELSALRQASKTEVPMVARSIQEIGKRHSHLSSAMRKDALKGQSDLESYIRKIAAFDRVEIGDVNISNTQAPASTRGSVDRKYTIKPTDRNRSFPRAKIANFLYKLEAESQRVRVTDISIEVADKRIKPHEIPEDNWTFEAELTSRQRTE